MRLTVIFTTYNQVPWLEKTLWGFHAQTYRNFRLIVADDGSGPATEACIDRMRLGTGMDIVHCWHPDRGFRKSTILNRALEQVETDYCVFTDGDCIPRADFLAQHVKLARPGRFLSGGYFKLTLPISEAVTREDILSGRVHESDWLRERGQPRRKMRKLRAGRLGGLMDFLTTTKASWNGHNASGWTADLLAVNGFDERMEYGGQDREFGERLENAGIRGLCIRHRAVTVHLEHGRSYARPESIQRNRAIRAATRYQRLVRTPYGITEHESETRPAATPVPLRRSA